MAGRKKGSASQRFRLIPVFKAELDRQAFARALLLLAEHHQTTRTTDTTPRKEDDKS